MSKRLYKLFAVILLLAANKAVVGQVINDHIFPASATAKPYIDFDSKGFLVNGNRTFIVSAGLEYARVPHQLWYDRLLRIKRAGFNCVEIYTIWNFHEAHEGKFDFTGDRDLPAFLSMVKKLGMYAIVRVGPYFCGEWDNGGYPTWLKFKPGLRVREPNGPYEKYVDRFFDRIFPVVFNQQINKGGPVIMVQLENEHPKGWGTIMPNAYFKHLQSKALNMGLQVPYFFSGLHHASDPALNGNFDDAKRPNPWFSTEFWSVWYSQYGAKPGDDSLYDRRTWKVISQGGNGYNYYMAHGGSNFGYTNNNEDAATYDYGAAIGQAGDLRPIYYTFKRAAWFARSFQNILENSTTDTVTYRNLITDTALRVTARKSPAGNLVFIDNPGKQPVKAMVQSMNNTLQLAPGEIYPLVHNFMVSPLVTIDWALTKVFAVVKQHKTTTIIANAENGSTISLQFITKGKATATGVLPDLKINGSRVDISGQVNNAAKPSEYKFTVGDETIRVLVMNRRQTDNTFIIDNTAENYIISGAPYIGYISINNKTIQLNTEQPLTAQTPGDTRLYTAQEALLLTDPVSTAAVQPKTLALAAWQFKGAANAAKTIYETKGWLATSNPAQMGADGDLTADAWYRTSLNIPANGNYSLQVKGGGNGQAYIDGKKVADWKLDAGELMLNLKKGRHTLAVFTAHDGRDKLAAYLGPIDKVDRKGLFDTVYLKKGGPYISTLNNWYFAKAAGRDALAAGVPKFDTLTYKKYKIGADAFDLKQGFGWFSTLIPKPAAGTSKVKLSFKSVDENTTVFINGKQVSRNEGWNIPFEVTITNATVLKQAIRVTLFIENYSNEGGIDQPVTVNTIGTATIVKDWKMKGGPGSFNTTAGWANLHKQQQAGTGPCFYRSAFTWHKIEGQTLIWRIDPKNMGHGSIWVNGHNLGRYPEKVAVDGLYIPECWLTNGTNQLVIYDEDGKLPTAAQVIAEPGAGRVTHDITVNTK